MLDEIIDRSTGDKLLPGEFTIETLVARALRNGIDADDDRTRNRIKDDCLRRFRRGELTRRRMRTMGSPYAYKTKSCKSN